MSSYLVESRLQDIIAAIQVMGSYPKFTSRETDRWEAKLGKPKSGADWYDVCSEHPEFFRTNVTSRNGPQKWVGLRWRWALDEDYSPTERVRLGQDRIDGLPSGEKKKLTRPPLESSQIEALISSAIQLHSRAIEDRKEARWLLPIIIPAAMGLVGVIIGALGAAWLKLSVGA